MHSCLKPFSIGPKAVFKQHNTCSNHKIHMPFEHGFRLKSVNFIGQCVVTSVLHRNKMAYIEKAPRFSMSFYIVNVILKRF